MIELKAINKKSLSNALEKAKRYRLLGEPDDAQSICLDVLDVEPDNEEALVLLLLAITDKFNFSGINPAFNEAKEVLAKMKKEFNTCYYSGLVYERRAKFHLKQGSPGAGAATYEWLVRAMDAFEKAIATGDEKSEDAVLRWNSCARLINSRPDVKKDDSGDVNLTLDPYETPH